MANPNRYFTTNLVAHAEDRLAEILAGDPVQVEEPLCHADASLPRLLYHELEREDPDCPLCGYFAVGINFLLAGLRYDPEDDLWFAVFDVDLEETDETTKLRRIS